MQLPVVIPANMSQVQIPLLMPNFTFQQSRSTAVINKFRAPKGNVNVERSYEICRAVVQKSANKNIIAEQGRDSIEKKNFASVLTRKTDSFFIPRHV